MNPTGPPSFVEGFFMMIRKRDMNECQQLFALMVNPAVFPFVRHKAHSYEEYLFLTRQMIDSEDRGESISRTIVDEWGSPIGTINLYDIKEKSGFIGTWIGEPYFGKGYNQKAKTAFFLELFNELGIETVYMRIKKENTRSQKAAEKLPYVTLVSTNYVVEDQHSAFHLYAINKEAFLMHTILHSAQTHQNTEHAKEA
jgi:RimJ/RimL family protein N-acetyltransferase